MILAIDTILPWPDEQFFLAMTIIALVFSCVCALGDRLYVKESTKVIVSDSDDYQTLMPGTAGTNMIKITWSRTCSFIPWSGLSC